MLLTGSYLGVPSPYNASASPIAESTNSFYNQIQGGGPQPATAAPGAYTGPFANASIIGQPFAIFLGMVLLLFFFKFISEHDNTALDPRHVHIGGYNFLAVGVTAAVFLALLKMITQRWPVPGLTQFSAFV